MRWLNSEASLCKIVAKGFLTFDHRKMNCCAVVAKDSLNRVVWLQAYSSLAAPARTCRQSFAEVGGPCGSRRTRSAGEPNDTRSTARIGPSRANRSLNDDSIETHSFHQRLGDHHQIPSPDRIWRAILDMNASQQKHGVFRYRLGGNCERPDGRRHHDRDDGIIRHIVQNFERNLFDSPRPRHPMP